MLALNLNRDVINEIFEILSDNETEVFLEMEDHFLKMDTREFKKEVLLLGNEMFGSKALTETELVVINELVCKL